MPPYDREQQRYADPDRRDLEAERRHLVRLLWVVNKDLFEHLPEIRLAHPARSKQAREEAEEALVDVGEIGRGDDLGHLTTNLAVRFFLFVGHRATP